MELHHHHPLNIFLPHDGVSQPFGGKGLAHTRCTLQDDILFNTQNPHQFVIFFLREKYIVQKIRLTVGRVSFFYFLRLFRRVIGKNCVQFLHILRVGRHICQSFHHSLSGMLPAAGMRPFHAPHIAIIICTAIVKPIIRCHYTTANQLVSSLLDKNNIAHFHLIRKLPRCMSCIFIGKCRVVHFFHFCFHCILGRKRTQISNVTPTNSHNACMVKLIPLVCIVARCIKPIVYRFYILIRHTTQIILVLFLLRLDFVIDFLRIAPCLRR